MKTFGAIVTLIMAALVIVGCDVELIGMGGGGTADDRRIQAMDDSHAHDEKGEPVLSQDVTSQIASRGMEYTTVIPPTATPVLSQEVTSGIASRQIGNIAPTIHRPNPPPRSSLEEWIEYMCVTTQPYVPVCYWQIDQINVSAQFMDPRPIETVLGDYSGRHGDCCGGHSVKITMEGEIISHSDHLILNFSPPRQVISLIFIDDKNFENELNIAEGFDSKWGWGYFKDNVMFWEEGYITSDEVWVYLPLESLDNYLGVLEQKNLLNGEEADISNPLLFFKLIPEWGSYELETECGFRYGAYDICEEHSHYHKAYNPNYMPEHIHLK